MNERVRSAATATVVIVAGITAIWGMGSSAVAGVGDPVYLGASNNESTQGTTIRNTSGEFVYGCNTTDSSGTGLEVCGPDWALIARGGGGVLAEAERNGTGVLGYGRTGLAGIGRGGP